MARTPLSITNRFSEFMSWFSFGGTTNAPVLDQETALLNSAVHCAVSTIATSVGMTPLNLIEVTESGGLFRRKQILKHPILDLLKQPNPNMHFCDFMTTMVVNALLGEGALAIKVFDGAGVLRELHPVPFAGWVIERAPDGTHQFLVSMADGSQRTFVRKEVIFVHGPSINSVTGIAAVEVAKYAHAISAGIEKQLLGFSSNGGRPSGILSFPEGLKPETRQRLRDSWNKTFGDGAKSGVAILDNSAKYETIQHTFADAQTIDMRKFQINEIARYFRIHPAFLQNGDVITDVIMRAFVSGTLAYWFKNFEDTFTLDLLGDPNLRFDFDETALLRGDWANLGTFIQSMLGNGGTPAVISINEGRAFLGLDPIDADYAKVPLRGGYAGADPNTPVNDTPTPPNPST